MMIQVEPIFYFRNDCNDPGDSLVLELIYKPSVGNIEIVIDYQAGAGERRDFRRWIFSGVQSIVIDGRPWDGSEEDWKSLIRQRVHSVDLISVAPIRAVSRVIVAYKLDFCITSIVRSITFNFSSMFVEQRFGVAIANHGGKSWVYRDATTGEDLDYYHPFSPVER